MRSAFRHLSIGWLVVGILSIALVVFVAGCAKAAPTATPRPAATPTAAPTATATPRPAATPTAAPTATAAPAATPTATPRPAATPTPTPTAAPVVRIRTAAGATPWVDQNAKKGGVLRYGERQAINEGFDPPQASASRAVILGIAVRGDRLVRYNEPDPAKPLVGELAKSWEIATGGKRITFALREGVKWQDGSAFTSADVKATLDRIKSPPPGVATARSGFMAQVDTVDAPDALTMALNLKAPFAAMPYFLANGHMIMMQKQTLEKYKFDLTAVPDWPGTGPFKYVSNSGKDIFKYERNPNYWNGDLPLLDGYEFYSFDPDNIGPALAAGRIDISKLVSGPSQQILDRRSDIKSNQYSGFFDFHFHMNRDKPPFNDVRVRQAVNLILDRVEAQKGFTSVRGPIWVVGSKWVPVGSSWEKDVVGASVDNVPGFHPGGPTQAEIAEAKKLMADAGFPNGFGNIVTDVRPDLTPSSIIMVQMLNASLEKYLPGSKLELKAFGRAESYQRILNNDLHASFVAFSLAAIDHPTQWLGSFYQTGSGQNFARYKNPEFDAIVDQLYSEPDRQKVVELTKKGIALLERDMPAIPLGLWNMTKDYWFNYVKGSSCEAVVMEHNQCIKFDTTWLDK